jgi:hypothetical protein
MGGTPKRNENSATVQEYGISRFYRQFNSQLPGELAPAAGTNIDLDERAAKPIRDLQS